MTHCLCIQEAVARDHTWLSSSIAMEPPVCSNRNWQFSVSPWRAAMCSPVVMHERHLLYIHNVHVHMMSLECLYH